MGLVLFQIHRNTIFLFFHPRPKALKELVAPSGEEIQILSASSDRRIGAPGEFSIKVRVPYARAPLGCEYLQIHAVLTLGGQGQDSFSRYRVPMRYDPRNRRCESDDLGVSLQEYPDPKLVRRVVLQFLDFGISATFVEEEPRSEGFVVDLDWSRQEPWTLGWANLGALFPLQSPWKIRKEGTFSAQVLDSDITLGIQPFDDLGERMVQEIEARTEKCLQTRVCDRIWMAVADFRDRRLARALEMARSAGMDVDVIMNAGSILSPEVQQLSPLLWVRHGQHNNDARLIMHTKFALFGQDLVISSNANFSFENYPHSREVFVEYRSPSVNRIFSEVFGMIRTRLFYPLLIDRTHDFVLLWNADRPRGYSASVLKPYAQLRDENAQSADAYGHIFSWIQQSDERLELAMSPLTNSCSYLGKWRCLFDVLADKAKQGQLKLHYNAYFAVREWDSNHRSLGWKEPFTQLLEAVGANDVVRVHQSYGSGGSLHHERIGRLGRDVVLVGSANYARPSTLNTIEWIRSKRIAREVDQVLGTFDEPYFVFPKKNLSQALLTVDVATHGDCMAAMSRDILNTERKTPLKKFSLESLIAEIQKLGWRIEDLRWWAPRMEASGDGGPGDWVRINGFSEQPVPSDSVFESKASTFCFENRRLGRSHVFLLDPLAAETL